MTLTDLSALDFSGAIDELAAPAVVIDRDGRFSWVNRAHIELFGDLRGRPFLDNIVPEDRKRARTTFAQKVVGKTTSVFDVNVLDRTGAKVTMRVSSAPLRRGNEVVGVLGIALPVAQPAAIGRSVLDDLTPRQKEVLGLLTEGLETAEIARRLGVAEETARNHIRALLRATGAHSRLEAVLMNLRLGANGGQLTHPGQQDGRPATDD